MKTFILINKGKKYRQIIMDEKEFLYHKYHGIVLQSYQMLKFHIDDKTQNLGNELQYNFNQ